MVYAVERMSKNNWRLVDTDLRYSGNQGIDMVFERRMSDGQMEYAIMEAKHSPSLLCKRDARFAHRGRVEKSRSDLPTTDIT